MRTFFCVSLFFLILSFFIHPGFAQGVEERLKKADSLFQADQFREAAGLYEQLMPGASGVGPRVELLLKLGECFYRLGDYRAARQPWRRAWEEAPGGGHPDLTARSRYCYGRVLARLAEYEQAKVQLNEALVYWQKDPAAHAEAIGEAIDALSMVHLLLDELREAEARSLEAVELLSRELGPDHLQVAKANCSLGNIYSRMGRSDEAESRFRRCIEIREARLPYPHILLGTVYYNYNNFLQLQGRLTEARTYLRRALDIYEALDPEHPRTGDAYQVMGQRLVDFGDYRAGRDYFLKALRIFRNAYGEKQERVGTIYNLLANIYRLNGDFEQARSYADRGLDITRSAVGPAHDRVASGLTTIGDIEADAGNYDASLRAYREALDLRRRILGDDHTGTAFLYYQVGQTTLEAGRPAESLPLLERAVTIYRDRGLEDTEDITNVYAALGRTYLEMKDYSTAIDYLRRDERILRSLYGENHPYLADSYRSLGLWHQRQGNLDSAMVFFHGALRAMSLDFDDRDLHSVPPLSGVLSPYEFLDMLKRKGDALAERAAPRDLEAALATYRRGAEQIDALRSQYRSQGAKLFFQQNADPVFTAGFRTAVRLYDQTRRAEFLESAFWFAERSKAGLLTAALQGVAGRPFTGVPDSLRLQAEALRSRLDGQAQMVMDERLWPSDTGGAQLRELKKEEVRLQTSYDSLLALLESRYPQFFQLNYGTEIMTLPAIQRRLADGKTALLEYFLADSTLYTFIITREEVRLVAKPWEHSNEEIIAFLRRPPAADRWLSDPQTLTTDYLQKSHRLYEQLVGDQLTGLDCRRLVIIPHGVLAYLPFECLAADEEPDFRRAAFLGGRYAIHYGFSATLWSTDIPDQSSAGRRFLGIAPAYGEGPAVNTSVASLNFRGPLGPLHYSEEEIRRAAFSFPGTLLTGTGATESAFKRQAPQAGILHLAMHALVSDSLPLQSALLFSPERDTLEDGLLHAYELYNMNLPARLAVLSACNTGFGRLQAGEGAMSLAHAFRYAGCRSIVMTLWPAEDEGTASLMERFYHHLASGLAKDEALRRARLDYLKAADPRRTHPYYWAHLVAVGDMRPLKRSFRFPAWMVVLAIGLIAGVAFFLWSTRARPQKL